MTASLSLRARLIFVILLPLLMLALLIGAWAYFDAQDRASERFERSLLSTALAISRDTAFSGGDALSRETRDLLRDTSGGSVFYHVYAPDGVFVTGYATPPVPPDITGTSDISPAQTYYDAIYQGQTVQALRFTQIMTMDGLSGPFTFTVWQNTALRDGFVRGRTQPVFLIIASLTSALALLVWFGVRIGLRPLDDLENAIARRSADDLSAIKRKIPVEVNGIVGRLNTLLDEMQETLKAKNIFISDAAHQLRNPIAGVLSLAEAVETAPTQHDAKLRSRDLVDAARQTSMLANNLLTLERARAAPPSASYTPFDPVPLLGDIAQSFGKRLAQGAVTFEARLENTNCQIAGDPVLFEQAVLNLLNNALLHGGKALSQITLASENSGLMLEVSIGDDGKGISPQDQATALARFSQVEPSTGSGLGLPIASAIAEAFDGDLRFENTQTGFAVVLSFPVLQPDASSPS